MPPEVLIGIPTLNGPERLDRALASIKKHTDLTDATVLVTDDLSTPRNLEANKRIVASYKIEMLMTQQRYGIATQWNRLTRHVPEAPYVVLINDDIEVVDDWLDVLIFSLKHNCYAGMVGLRSEAGTKSNSPPRSLVDYNESTLLDGSGTLVSSGGACFAFRRVDWEAVGGFDERYFCYYEEVDFGVALASKLDRVNYIASYPILHHMIGATISTNHNSGKLLVDSREKFAAKWEVSLDTLREQFSARALRPTRNWNTQWKNWRLP